MPQQPCPPLACGSRPRPLLGRQLQHRFNGGSPSHINQFVHRQPRLFNQIDHRQQALSMLAEKLRQLFCVCLSFPGDGVTASLQGGSPFLENVSNPTLPRIGSRNAPQPPTTVGTPSSVSNCCNKGTDRLNS